MCMALATLGMVAKGASAGLTALSAFSQYQQGRAVNKQSKYDARAVNQKAARDAEIQLGEDRYREGQEIVDSATSGISGSFGSPFLVAIENAENAAINRGNIIRAGENQANNIRIQGENAEVAGTNALFNGIGSVTVQGYKGYQGYRKNRANAIYLGDSTIPGIA